MMKSKGTAGQTLSGTSEEWNRCIQLVGERQDREAFSRLFAHFAPYLKAFLLKSGGLNPENAEELVQETMIKVWRKAPTFSPAQASASTWIYTIAKNVGLNELRRNKRLPLSLHEAFDTGEKELNREIEDANLPSPDEEIIQKDENEVCP